MPNACHIYMSGSGADKAGWLTIFSAPVTAVSVHSSGPAVRLSELAEGQLALNRNQYQSQNHTKFGRWVLENPEKEDDLAHLANVLVSCTPSWHLT